MSEALTDAPAEDPTIQVDEDGFKSRLITVSRVNETDYLATDARGRALLVRKLDEAEKADLYEAAEDVLSVRWMMQAEAAATVRAIDGVPCTFPDKKVVIKGRLRLLGSEGMDVARGVAGLASQGRIRNRYEVAGENPVAAKN